jgi:hypothetical protein
MARTVRWIWIALLVIAVALRLPALNLVPLAPDETIAALGSLDATRGGGWPQTGESPLLEVGNALLFFVLGAGDGVARLLPALAGVALVGLPFLWRKRLGEIGALVAAGLLTGSPLVLFASRRLEATILGLLGAGLLVTALMLVDDDAVPPRLWPALVVLGFGIGLTGGPSFYDGLLSGVGAWLFYRWASGKAIALPSRRWARPAVEGLVVALLISIGLGFRWSGWDGPGDGLAAWLRTWRAAGVERPGLSLLLLYEPLTLLLALLGLGLSFVRTEPFPLALGLWGLLALLLTSLRPGASPSAFAASIIPLVLLAGCGMRRLVTGVDRGLWKWVGLHTLLGFILWLPVGLAIANHAANNTYAVAPGSAILGGFAVVVLGVLLLAALQALLSVMFSLVVPTQVLWRDVLFGAAATLLVVQFGFAWGLAFLRPASPAEPAVTSATSSDVWNLRRTVDDLALSSARSRDMVEITVVDSDPILTAVIRWTLRDFPGLQVAASWPEATIGVVVTPAETMPALSDAGSWKGMRFVATVAGAGAAPACQQLLPPNCPDLAKWYLYRKLPTGSVVAGQVILWGNP